MGRFSIGWLIIFSLIVTLGYFLGLLTFLTDLEKNGCDMTYMYEYPQFVRILVKEDEIFERYGLYAYSEGHLTKNVRDMYFDGTPVLFIPGNAGSYRQVRSFASVALRKSLSTRNGAHFDFFAVDLNEELNGLNGALLTEQMNYVNHSIGRVLELYNNKGHIRKSVIIIGHSMGGIIARGLIASLPEDSVLLPVIITLATPHLRPPTTLDSYMTDFYRNIGQTMPNKKSTVVALSGGFNDIVVSPFYTNTQYWNFIHVTTTSVPLVWLSTDHLCILWCKQLVLEVIRSLFALVNANNHKLILNSTYHQVVFKHYLTRNNGVKLHKLSNYRAPLNFTLVNAKWVERLQMHYTVSLPQGVKQVEWHMIRLLNQPNHEYLTVLAINLEVTDWIFACAATHVENQQRICPNGLHLSHLSQIAPSIQNKRRLLTINMFELKKNYTHITHVVVRVLPTREPVALHMDIYEERARKIDVELPKWWSIGRQIILKLTKEKVIHYELVLPHLNHVTQFFKLYVEPLKCIENANHHATASLHIPWTNQQIHKYITKHEKKPLKVRLFSSRPQGYNASFPAIFLTLDPACVYSISIESSLLGMCGNMARTYTPLLVANIAAVVLLSFKNQLINIHQTGSCSVFFNSMKIGAKPYYILTMVKVSSKVLSLKDITRYLPIPDWQQILEEGNDFFFLPLLLYMCSVGIVWLLSLCLATSMFVCEASVNKLALKFLSHTISAAFQLSDWVVPIVHKLPVLVAIVLIMLSLTACGGVALLFGSIFYFMKLIVMSQEYVESIVMDYVKFYAKQFFMKGSQEQIDSTGNSDENSDSSRQIQQNSPSETHDNISRDPAPYSALFFHFSIMLLWGIITAIHIPHVLTWSRNFRYSTELKPDPSFLPGFILSLCAIPLWQLDVPRTNKKWYIPLSKVINLVAAAALLYTPISLYRLVYLLTAVIVLITLHQIFAPAQTSLEEENIQNNDDGADIEHELNKMKAKLE